MNSLPTFAAPSDSTTIYALVDHRNEIRYVGLTKLPVGKRLMLHVGAAKSGNPKHAKRYCYNWIRSLLRNGHKPGIFVLDVVNGNGCEEEKAWISRLRNAGARLTNRSDGGEGCAGWGRTWTDEQRRRMSEMKRNTSDETRRRQSLAKLGKKMPAGFSETMSKRLRGKTMTPERLATHRDAIQRYWDTHPHLPRTPRHSAESKRRMSEYRRKFWEQRRAKAG